MRTFYVICVVTVIGLKIVASAPAKEIAVEGEHDDSKLVEKRSVGKDAFPAFGASNGLNNDHMVDWNQVYSKKDAAKRFSLHADANDGFENHGLKNLNMLDWERVFNKRQWNNKENGFGNIGALSNPEMQNWSKVFARKRAFGMEDNGGLGKSNGLESQNLQDWSSIFGRRRRNIDQ